MISINDYIDRILADFLEYVEDSDCLCELLDLHFDGGHFPDYSSLPVQQLYLLRYAYGYAFEHKQMFLSLAPDKWAEDPLIITSIGCGAMLDYWAARMTLDNAGRNDLSICYNGVDLLSWAYQMPEAKGDTVEFQEEDALTYLRNKETWDDDVFIFPKSISEFSSSDFDRMCRIFRRADYEKDCFYVMANLRTEDTSRKRDVARVAQLADAIKDAGFSSSSPCDKYWKAKDPDKKIREVDPDFRHPREAVALLTCLDENCNSIRICWKNREACKELLNRWPILKQGQLAYQILRFERG